MDFTFDADHEPLTPEIEILLLPCRTAMLSAELVPVTFKTPALSEAKTPAAIT
ncbi:MAG TPA: hypothetical protein VGM76_01710 [Lacipirellulaceae bacterium]